mgnify:CR=1 FL=1
MTILYIILVILAILIIWIIASYNSLVRKRFRVREAWSDIDVQLKRRHDLIPNLVETVKGYMTHERKVFDDVTEARAKAVSAKDKIEQAGAEDVLSNTLKTLFAVAENYPELKANANFLDLQRELADTENKIQAARRFYNTNVRDLNIATDSFPSNFVAKMFNFSKMEFFDLGSEEAARQPVNVQF